MSETAASSVAGDNWVEELQNNIFQECVAQVHADEEAPVAWTTQYIPVGIIFENIRRSFASVPHFRFIFLSKSQRNEFLEELKSTLLRAARDGKRIGWRDFRDASKYWFVDLVNACRQDSGNNVHENGHSDLPAETSHRDDRSYSDTLDDEHSESVNQLDVATCYSLNSSSVGLGTTDSMIEYSDETDGHTDDDIAVDLQVRIRRCNEEAAGLKDELLRAEETISTLESDVKSKEIALEKLSNKYSRLQKEIEDHRNLLSKAEKKEELCKLELRVLGKAHANLEKKVKQLERDKENVSNLKLRIEDLSKENLEYKSKLADYKSKYEKKQTECEYLQEEYNELQASYSELQKSYEKELQQHLDRIQELQHLNDELQSRLNNTSSDISNSQLSLTPPSHVNAHIHSTPYNNKKSNHESLYSELRASGFNTEEAKVQELKEKLSFYGQEIGVMSDKIDEAFHDIAASRNEICAPNVQLVETNSIETLKHKVASLLNLVKKCSAVNESSESIMREDCREKPDVLPQTKRGCYIFSERDFTSEKAENDGISSTTTTIVPSVSVTTECDKSISPQLPDISGVEKLDLTDNEEPEVIIPINEVLKTLKEQKDTEDDSKPSQKSIFTAKRSRPDWSSPFGEASNVLHVAKYGKGNGAVRVNPKIVTSPQASGDGASTMKALKNDNRNYESSPDISTQKLDTRYVTMSRPSDKTYLVNPVISSTVEKTLAPHASSFDEMHTEIPLCRTPSSAGSRVTPQRKLSVYHRSFDVDSLQSPDRLQSVIGPEKKRSVSTPDVQETVSMHINAVEKDPLHTTYRSRNVSAELSDSSSSSKLDESLAKDFDDSPVIVDKTDVTKIIRKPVLLAPTKFKLPDSTENQTNMTNHDLEFTPIVGKGILSKAPLVEKKMDNDQSRILSSSANLIKKEENSVKSINKNETTTLTLEASSLESFKLSLESTRSISGDSLAGCNSTSKNVLQQHNQIVDKTYTMKGAETRRKPSSGAPVSMSESHEEREASVSGAASSNSSKEQLATTRSGAPETVVGRAMSSGEDSSAESECDPRKNATPAAAPAATIQPKTPVAKIDEKQQLIDRTKSHANSGCGEDKVKTSPIMNGDDKENICQNAAPNSPAQEVIKEEQEAPKAFPSWTDQKLQESGIANLPDVDSEISENLSEEQLKKKYTAFSIGLGADRMTLSKRLILSRRHRDQAEKNFTNEVYKMQQDIKDLAPLCVDSESLERVERTRLQLEMVARCAHRISCSAETLGAVHQERRVSRAVLLADKYLQTLRSKCEKIGNELTETKRILAENNIVLEENLSELGDDVPRVRYRAVPNNNRTMMARRRASIATISRPLLGSNQDISKDVPRQRNSVSGRVSGVRRPSLCFETPKWESDKLDRADSNSITEFREIFEESRRQSQEENNNVIRTVQCIANEQVVEEEVWSHPHEEVVPETDGIETNYAELRQHHRHPIICWLLARYAAWKPMLWAFFIAFLLGIFVTRVVSSSKRSGPPLSWWSIEEILSQYIHVENERRPGQRVL